MSLENKKPYCTRKHSRSKAFYPLSSLMRMMLGGSELKAAVHRVYDYQAVVQGGLVPGSEPSLRLLKVVSEEQIQGGHAVLQSQRQL